MKLPDYDSPVALKNFLDERGMAMQKKFGQNFLVNANARERLVDALELKKGTKVWEIGPGLGSMTSIILERKADLTAFEIDRGFCSALEDIFQDKKNFSLVPGDVLKNWKKQLEEKGAPERLFGNLPYNIASAILADMIEENIRFDIVVVTVQKEVAMRMAAKPKDDDYSSFSVLCQWAYDVEPLMDLAGGSFWPRPNVDSRAVKLTKKKDFPRCKDVSFFLKFMRSLFVLRRKTIKNNLTQFYSSSEKALKVLEAAGVSPLTRAETLSVEEILRISDIAYDMNL